MSKRKAEKKWRSSKSQDDLRAFKVARNRVTNMMHRERTAYYTDLISENGSDQGKLFRITKSLLFESSNVEFPRHIQPNEFATILVTFSHRRSKILILTWINLIVYALMYLMLTKKMTRQLHLHYPALSF